MLKKPQGMTVLSCIHSAWAAGPWREGRVTGNEEAAVISVLSAGHGRFFYGDPFLLNFYLRVDLTAKRTDVEQKHWPTRVKQRCLFLEWRKGRVNPTINIQFFLTTIHEQQCWSQQTLGRLTRICSGQSVCKTTGRGNWTLDVFLKILDHYT